MRLFREIRRRRALRRWFVTPFYRERHELYLRILAIMQASHRRDLGDRPVSGATIKSALFRAPCSIEVDSALVSDMLMAMRIDGVIEKVDMPPEGTVRELHTYYTRWQLTFYGSTFLDLWWVRETLAKLPPLPDAEELFASDV